jgi:hypothetical protein
MSTCIPFYLNDGNNPILFFLDGILFFLLLSLGDGDFSFLSCFCPFCGIFCLGLSSFSIIPEALMILPIVRSESLQVFGKLVEISAQVRSNPVYIRAAASRVEETLMSICVLCIKTLVLIPHVSRK